VKGNGKVFLSLRLDADVINIPSSVKELTGVLQAKRITCVADESFSWISYNIIYIGCIVIYAGEANAGYRPIWIGVFDDSGSTRTATSHRIASEARLGIAIAIGVSAAKTVRRIITVATILVTMTRTLVSDESCVLGSLGY
jgi:hypothetical protein